MGNIRPVVSSLSPTSDATQNGTGVRVALGEHEYHVYAQRIGYLENKLGRWINEFAEGGFDGANVMALVGDNAHTLLGVFIPRLMPLHEFRGYRTEDAMANGDYDPEGDGSPTVDQIVTAFEVAVRVNRFDLFKHMRSLVDPQMLRDLANQQIAEAVLRGTSSPTESSTTTPPTTSTASGPTSPTLTANGDSPSLD
jgi:hypothetical protein